MATQSLWTQQSTTPWTRQCASVIAPSLTEGVRECCLVLYSSTS